MVLIEFKENGVARRLIFTGDLGRKHMPILMEVLERLEVFAPGGGFVFNPIHNIQPKTPVENVIAMFEAIREFNG